MGRPILVVDANKEQCKELCAVLEGEHYRAIPFNSLVNLEEEIQVSACQVVILDLDTLSVDDRFITKLRRNNPGLPIMALSSRPFHPELKEAMSTHICACLGKPPDLEELIYCVRAFCGDRFNSGEVLKEEEPGHA